MSGIEPEIGEKLISRREVLLRAGKLGIVALSAPLAVGVLAHGTFGQNSALPAQIVDVLNFALTLEELESEFYNLGNKAGKLIPKNTEKVFDTLRSHEEAHVKLLRSVLGGKAVAKPRFDFTAGGTFPDVFTNYQTFLALSQAFEDTGVRAYKGQATNLMANGAILQTALQIHLVEARHAAMIRRIRGEKEWITGNSRGTLPAAAQPIDDAFAAYQWVLANAATFGDAKRVAVVGESAGGNLACNVSMMARDKNVQMPLAQVLVYPIANNDLNAPSILENTSPKLTLNSPKLPWFYSFYLTTPSESNDPRLSLVRANLRGLPPTTIINAQIDPLRSEGELLAQKMREAGVKVEQKTYNNVAHEFFGMAAVLDTAKAANAQAFKALRGAFRN